MVEDKQERVLPPERMTRREFLRSAAVCLIAAGAALSPLTAQAEGSKKGKETSDETLKSEKNFLNRLIRERTELLHSPIREQNILEPLANLKEYLKRGEQENALNSCRQAQEAIVGNEIQEAISEGIQELQKNFGEERNLKPPRDEEMWFGRFVLNLVRMHYTEGMNLQAVRELFKVRGVTPIRFEDKPEMESTELVVLTLIGDGSVKLNPVQDPTVVLPVLHKEKQENSEIYFGYNRDGVEVELLQVNPAELVNKPPYGLTFAMMVPYSHLPSFYAFLNDNWIRGVTNEIEYPGLYNQKGNCWKAAFVHKAFFLGPNEEPPPSVKEHREVVDQMTHTVVPLPEL